MAKKKKAVAAPDVHEVAKAIADSAANIEAAPEVVRAALRKAVDYYK